MAKPSKAKLKDVEERIVPVVDADPHVRVLVYGKNGKGKTRFAASGPKTIIVDCNEHGTRSVRNYPDAYVFHAKSWNDLQYIYWYLRDADHDHETVVIDTLTQAQNICMSHVLKRAEDRDPNRPPAMPDRRAWGQLGELMKPWILDFRNLPMHVVFVCQIRRDRAEEDSEEVPGWVPDMSPSVRGTAMSAVEIMGMIFRKEVEVVKKVKKGGKVKKVTGSKWETMMLIGDHDMYETKDRSFHLPRVLRNPTMDHMIEASFHIPEEEDE